MNNFLFFAILSVFAIEKGHGSSLRDFHEETSKIAHNSNQNSFFSKSQKGSKSKNGKSRKRKVPENEKEMEIIVKYINETGKNNARKHGKMVKNMESIRVAMMKVKEIEAKQKYMQLKEEEGIEMVEMNIKIEAMPYLRHNKRELQGETIPYGITLVQSLDLIENADREPEALTICVVDTGYGLNHPDLPSLSDGVTGTDTSAGVALFDGDSHGTHISGIIGAIGNNGLGVVGVNPDPTKFNLHIGKGLSDEGTGSTFSLLEAVSGCFEKEARVISLSLGGTIFSQISESVFKQAYEDKGMLIIAAAGNDGESELNYPASYPHVISVAAVDRNEDRVSFSQYNGQLEIAGPGLFIESTITSDSGTTFSYAEYSGTSMATPHVSGVAALLWSYFPECSNREIRGALIKSAKDRGAPGCDEEYGFGIVQAKDAYDLLRDYGCSAAQSIDPPVGGCAQLDGSLPPPPAPEPPLECAFGQTKLRVTITTDEFPSETSWTIDSLTSGFQLASSPPYSSSRTTYESEHCIRSFGCYIFTIRDTFGDGVCCEFGEGSYSLTLGSNSFLGGIFEYEDTAIISPFGVSLCTLEGRKSNNFHLPSEVLTAAT